MSDLYTKYLKSQGIRAPYESMTEAQINEQNKLNPLSGFGFQSAQERRLKQQQQALYQEMLQRQQDQEMQQLLARMPAERAIGHYAGSGIGGLLNGLFNRNQTANAEPQDDPEITRFNQLSSQIDPETQQPLGPTRAKLILGQQLVQQGNPAGAAMIEEAQKELLEQEKAELGNTKLRQEVESPNREYEHKPGYSEERDVPGPGGMPFVERWQLLKNTPEGGVWKVTARGPKGSVTGDAASFKGKSDTSKTVQEFETSMTYTANALDAMDKAEALVKENPNITGWSGRLIAKTDDILSGIKGLANQVGTYEGKGDYTSIEKYDWGKLEKTAAGSEKLKALVLELAASRAGATEPGGRFTEGDIQRQIDQIGGQIANPKTFQAVIQQARETMVDNLVNKGRFMTVDGKPVGAGYQSQLNEFNSRIGRGTVTVKYPNGKTKKVPSNHPSLKNLPQGYEVVKE